MSRGSNSSVWSWKGQRPLSGWRSIIALRIPWAELDWLVLALAIGLAATGTLFVHTMALADLEYGREGVSFDSHLKKLVLAVPMLVTGLVLRPRWLRRNTWIVYGGAILLLLLVPIVGEERNNAKRWIPMPLGFDLQPSEFAKLGLILALGRALYRERLRTLGAWAKPALLALLPMGLVAAQPDLGTALTIVPVTLGMCWLAGAPGRTVLGIVLAGALFGGIAYQGEWIQGYQKKRIDTWISSFEQQELIAGRNGAAFHSYQARTGIGNGHVWGRGLGRGVANEAGHLPERESDSIFAVIAEETGLVGASILILAYLLMAGLLLIAAARVRERFSRLVVGGIGLYFASHFFIHVGVNLGLLPMTGLTLPLLSTGGSSLLASFLALGVALGLSARPERSLDLDAFRA